MGVWGMGKIYEALMRAREVGRGHLEGVYGEEVEFMEAGLVVRGAVKVTFGDALRYEGSTNQEREMVLRVDCALVPETVLRYDDGRTRQVVIRRVKTGERWRVRPDGVNRDEMGVRWRIVACEEVKG